MRAYLVGVPYPALICDRLLENLGKTLAEETASDMLTLTSTEELVSFDCTRGI